MEFRVVNLEAVWAYAVGKQKVVLLAEVSFEALPAPLVIADFTAIATDGDKILLT